MAPLRVDGFSEGLQVGSRPPGVPMNQSPVELPAIDLLVPLIFDELRAMAHRQLAREHGPVTLQTTELVHESYLRLSSDARVTSLGRAYFYAAASRAMR